MIRILAIIAYVVIAASSAEAHCRRVSQPKTAIRYSPLICDSGVPNWNMPRVAIEEESTPSKSAESTPADAKLRTLPKPKDADVPKKVPLSRKVDQFLVPSEGKKSEVTPEVKVGFFNHSPRDLVLEIHGEAVKIPSSQYVTVRLPRTFKWSEKGGKINEVIVPSDADGVEIVFRD
jgi:hypothetical protein